MNKRAILFLTIVAVAVSAQAQPVNTSKPTIESVQAILAKIAKFEYGGDPAPPVQLDELVGRLSGDAQTKKSVEDVLLKFVQSDATPAGKEFAFRQLSLVGSNAAIPVLAPLLIQVDTAEVARYALAAIPGTPADEALRKALAQAPSDRIRIGLINSLGRRRDAKAVQAISPLLASNNLELAAAASAALASISDRSALDALTAARKNAAGQTRNIISEATIVCADHFAERGNAGVAVSAYKQMLGTSEPAELRTRVLKSFAAADPKGALSVLSGELQSSQDRQVIAIGILNRIRGPEATKALLSEFPKLSTVGQVHALTAAASRGDASAKPVVIGALKSGQPAVRAAALTALGKLGDGSNVLMLAETASSSEEPEQSAARSSLHTMRGSEVDAAIVNAMGSSNGKVKAELIRAAGERAASSASDALVTAARESDPDVRREALRALRNVGGSGQVPPLLDMLLKASSAVERRDATLTLATVTRRSQPVPIDKVIAAYNSAPSREARMSLLDVMGQTSSPEALPLLRAGIKDSDAEVARAAILALSGWDNPTPLPDLLNLAKTAPRPAAEPVPAPGGPGAGRGGRGMPPPTNNIQILALRGVLRLTVLESKRSPAESGRLLGEVMSLASQLPEKRSVLSQLAYFPSQESLEVAKAAAKDPAVASEAQVALAQVQEALKIK